MFPIHGLLKVILQKNVVHDLLYINLFILFVR